MNWAFGGPPGLSVYELIEVAHARGVLYTLRIVSVGSAVTRQYQSRPDDARVAASLRRAIELTELGLALRRSVVQQQNPQGDAMVQVMGEIRRAKEQAWQQNPS